MSFTQPVSPYRGVFQLEDTHKPRVGFMSSCYITNTKKNFEQQETNKVGRKCDTTRCIERKIHVFSLYCIFLLLQKDDDSVYYCSTSKEQISFSGCTKNMFFSINHKVTIANIVLSGIVTRLACKRKRIHFH